MDILGYIEKIKAKPEHIRRRFAFTVSFFISFIIFAGWIASYSFSSSSVIANNDKGLIVEPPVSSLTAGIFNAFRDIKDIISGSNKIDYEAPIDADIIDIIGGKI